jgi:hypothetical protein
MVRRSGYPQTFKDRPADAVSALTVRIVRRRACIQSAQIGVELDHESMLATAVGASAEVNPTLASLFSPLQPGPGAD